MLFVMGIACGRSKQAVKIKGSDTEVNLVVNLAEDFHNSTPLFNLSVSGGGSGLGIASLLNGQADIANSSRAINHFEDSLFKHRGIGLKTFVFAEDAIAFVVSADFALDTITAADLSNILSGKQSNWLFLTGKNMPVNIYGRQSNSGTHDFVKQKLNIEFSPNAKEMNGNAQIIEAIKNDHSGIGYVGAGYVQHSGQNSIKVLRVSAAKGLTAISPMDEKAVAANSYFFQRPLYQYIKASSYQNVLPFLNYEKSQQGLAIIKREGYYAVPVK